MTEPASEIPHLAHVFKNRVEYVKQSSNMAVILHHPLLGRIRGIINNNVSEYLGIKYATLADHFAPPLPLKAPNPQPGDILDATSYG